MTTGKKTVLVTGAAGRIGRAFVRYRSDRYHLRLMDRREIADAPEGVETIISEITDRDRIQSAMVDVDAIVHLAADSNPEASWDSALNNNIMGAHTVFESAHLAGVPRIVYASSSHACAQHVREFGTVGPDAPVRPDNLYGVTKAFGEALGRYYSDRHGMSVVCLRIGTFMGTDDVETLRHRLRRMLASEHPRPYSPWQNVSIWLSGRDAAELITCSIEADVRFGIFYGTSNNHPAVFDLTETRRELGYAPQDSAGEILGEPYGPATPK